MLFPWVVALERQSGFRFAEVTEELCSLLHEFLVHFLEKFEVLLPLEVVPERVEDKGRFIFLNWQLRFSVTEPRVPGGSVRTIRVVLMQHVTVRLLNAAAEFEEAPGNFHEPRLIERERNKRTIARPDVRVGIFVEHHDVCIGCGHDSSVVVGVHAYEQEAAFVEINDAGAE